MQVTPQLGYPDPHDMVIADLTHCGYLNLFPQVEAHRGTTSHIGPGRALPWRDPILSAAEHLAAALVHLRRASAEKTPGAYLLYQAALAVAGGLARRFGKTINPAGYLPGQRGPR